MSCEEEEHMSKKSRCLVITEEKICSDMEELGLDHPTVPPTPRECTRGIWSNRPSMLPLDSLALPPPSGPEAIGCAGLKRKRSASPAPPLVRSPQDKVVIGNYDMVICPNCHHSFVWDDFEERDWDDQSTQDGDDWSVDEDL